MRTSAPLTALLLALLVSLTACSGPPSLDGDVPPQVMLDREARFAARQRAIENIWQSADAGELTRAGAREMLKRVAWQRASSSDLRTLAIRKLIEDEANLDDTRAMMGYMLPTESRMGHYDVLELISKTAVARDWQDLKGPLVRSLAFEAPTVPDAERPEYDALGGLSDRGDPLESVFDVFAGPAGPYGIAGREDDTLNQRFEAWALLTRLNPSGETVRAMIDRADVSAQLDEEARRLVDDAKSAVETFNTVPNSPEQLAWVGRLRRAENTDIWSRGESLMRELTPEKRTGVRLRHIAGLLRARAHAPEVYHASREDLLASLESSLNGIRKYSRDKGPSAYDRKREILYDWKDVLTWADLVLIETARRAVREEDVRAALFSQADRDHVDETTEYGGLFLSDAPGDIEARLYPPRPTQRYGDHRFVASEDMITQGDGAIFHYHFQAQDHNNDEYAGPSRGDIEYANRFGRSCLVFTFVDEDELNADYYQPDGARIDLGVIARPGT